MTFDWTLIRKYIFAIKKKDLSTHFNIFINNNYHTHFSDIFYDIIMYKIQSLNVNLQKSSRKIQNNSELIINYSNQILNKINSTKIINDKFC